MLWSLVLPDMKFQVCSSFKFAPHVLVFLVFSPFKDLIEFRSISFRVCNNNIFNKRFFVYIIKVFHLASYPNRLWAQNTSGYNFIKSFGFTKVVTFKRSFWWKTFTVDFGTKYLCNFWKQSAWTLELIVSERLFNFFFLYFRGMESMNAKRNINAFNGEKYSVWKFRIRALLSELNVIYDIDDEAPEKLTEEWNKSERIA